MKFAYRILFMINILVPIIVYAGTSGKIVGKVTDFETGQPLPGVTVMIEGTNMGAATQLDGTYTILNVPAGTYSLRFSMVGYARTVVQSVRVEIDLTTTVNVQLKASEVITHEVVISAQRPVVTKDVSASEFNIQTRHVQTLPAQTVTDVLTLQAGVEWSSSGIIVRGGGANQTVVMVDGFRMNDERSNIPYSAFGLANTQEIQLQTGGFNAEYGNVRSGVVNVITREGDNNRYSGTINISYAPPQQKHFGLSPYDPASYFNRPYTDPAVCWTGTNNGAWDAYTRSSYPAFQGWILVAQKTLQAGDSTKFLTPTAAQRIWEWQRRRAGDIAQPDYNLDAGFGGPVPIIGQYLGNLRFYLSHFRERDMFVVPLSRDAYTDNHTELKLNSDITPRMKLTMIGIYGEDNSVSPYEWTTVPTGYLMRSQSEVARLLTSSDGMNVLYMPGRYSPSSIYRYVVGLTITHMLTNNTFYDLTLQRSQSRYNTFQLPTRDTSKIYQPVPGYFVDEAPYGYWGYSLGGIDGVLSMGGWMNLGRDQSVISTSSLLFSITSQLGKFNQVKSGLQVYYDDLNVKSGTYSPSMSTWTRSLVYHVWPYRIGAYVQDKLEFEGFIANLGLRWDYSNPNSSYLNLNPYDPLFSAGLGNQIDQKAPKDKARSQSYLSPRLGISHPITENSKLYFNYGHFVSEPSSSYRYLLQRESNGQVDYIGNPNMSYEKTIAYELGFEQNVLGQFLLHVAAYYKDITNQPGWILFQNINTSVNYREAANNNYADIRGFELTLSKVTGGWVRGFLNYTYEVASNGYFGLTQYYQDINKQRQYLMLNPQEIKPVPTPFARANITFEAPESFGPKLAGINPLGGWSLSLLAIWKAGAHDTYNPNSIPGVSNNVQWVDYYDVDMRLARQLSDFPVRGLNMQIYLDITNLFNFKFLNMAGFVDSYDYQSYLASLCFPWEDGDKKGNDKIGDYRPAGVAYDPLEPNPNNDPAITARNNVRKAKKSYIDMPNDESMAFLNPRHVSIGLRISF